jgi:probable phosphoglycerate mutase
MTLTMTPLVLIRHAATQWNLDRRIQGRADPPLAPAGRAAVSTWRLPAELTGTEAGDWIWLTSPLARARETAALLRSMPASVEPALVEPALVEMGWGAWEGRRLSELRAEGGAAVAAMELAATGRPSVAVTHKGVIRALYAQARGWDMTERAPEKLRDGCAQCFLLSREGVPETDQLNLPLAP